MGTVRFAVDPGGARRVQVSPELSVASSAASKWAQPFDASLTDVFQMQGEIATKVALALDVALSASSKIRLEAKPTQNLAAYEAYLRGEEARAVSDGPSLRRAITYFEQAVALDDGFVEAWAELSRRSSLLYHNTSATPATGARALEAAQRALALAPERPEGHLAIAIYYVAVLDDPVRALPELERARDLAPSQAEYARSVADTERFLGRWEASLGHLEEARHLDPRHVGTLVSLGLTAQYLRRPAEARSSLDAGLAIAPGNLFARWCKAKTFLQEGRLAAARAELHAVPKEVEPTAVVVYVAYELVWVLDDVQRGILLRLTPSAFDGSRGDWAASLADAYALRNDGPSVRKYAEIARAALVEQLAAAPTNAALHATLGVSLALLGRKAEAIHEAQTAVNIQPVSRNAQHGPYIQLQLVRVLILTGDQEKALDTLAPLLKMPYDLTPAWLRIDPTFDPLRSNPRFQRLVAGG